MTEEGKSYTILEAAKIAGLTKNTVKGRLRKAPEGTLSKGPDGIMHLSQSGLDWLLRFSDNHPEPPVTEPPEPEEPQITTDSEEITSGYKTTGAEAKPPKGERSLLLDMLRTTNADQAATIRAQSATIESLTAELGRLTGLLEENAKQLSDTTQALHAAQSQLSSEQLLHAGTMQKKLTEGSEDSAAVSYEDVEPVPPQTVLDRIKSVFRFHK